MSEQTVTATWCGPFDAVVPGHGLARPGDQVKGIPAEQARTSAHWTVPGASTKKTTMVEDQS